LEISIDTSTKYTSIGLSDEGELKYQLSWLCEQNHSSEMVPALRRLLYQAGIKQNQVNAVFVAVGPGRFSALRVGISFAKAFTSGRAIPLVAVGTMDIEAYQYLGLGVQVCAVISAARDLVYTATYTDYNNRKQLRPEYGLYSPGELFSVISDETIVCGENAAILADHVVPRPT